MTKNVVGGGSRGVAATTLGGKEPASGGLEQLLERVNIIEEVGADSGDQVHISTDVRRSHAIFLKELFVVPFDSLA